jgi:hypothetical protein
VYTGENKTIRVGKADGSNVGQSGGSDNVTLQQASPVPVPSVARCRQLLLPLFAGFAAHVNLNGGQVAPGDTWQEATHGTDNQKYTGWNYTDYAEDHQHGVPAAPVRWFRRSRQSERRAGWPAEV